MSESTENQVETPDPEQDHEDNIGLEKDENALEKEEDE